MDRFDLISDTDVMPTGSPVIPKLLHLIWVGTTDQPAYVEHHLALWRSLMPAWTIRLWTNTDINEREFPADTLHKIRACTKGAQAADIMRYSIINRYGGVYMDTDVSPHRSLDPILDLGKPIILCNDLPVTWPYIINAFFAAVAGHPIMVYACRLCNGAVLNTTDVNMHTGPRVLGEAVWNSLDKPTLLHPHYFYNNMAGQQGLDLNIRTTTVENRFGSHFYAKGW